MTFSRWGQDDADAALDHLRAMDRGPTYDAAAAAMVTALLRNDPLTAERLYDTIEDADQQRFAAMALHEMYSETDPDRAARYQAIVNGSR
ncbi:MAG: hypothetical protein P8Y95_02365 [Gammaproteobacteria bacterium]|jgi:hypothetical protein